MNLLAPIYSSAQSLLSRLTTDRAGNLDQISATRMAKVDALEARLTSARAAHFDLIDDIDNNVDTLVARISATRAGYIDAINTGVDTLEGRLTAARAGYIDRLVNGGIPGTVKSVQRGEIAFQNTDGGGTVAISAVNTSKAIVIASVRSSMAVYDPGGADIGFAHNPSAGIKLNSSTSLYWACTGYNIKRDQWPGVIYWQVIDYY